MEYIPHSNPELGIYSNVPTRCLALPMPRGAASSDSALQTAAIADCMATIAFDRLPPSMKTKPTIVIEMPTRVGSSRPLPGHSPHSGALGGIENAIRLAPGARRQFELPLRSGMPLAE